MYRIGLHAAKQPIEKNIAYIIICSVGRLPKLRILDILCDSVGRIDCTCLPVKKLKKRGCSVIKLKYIKKIASLQKYVCIDLMEANDAEPSKLIHTNHL
jgi:hypothetical protein